MDPLLLASASSSYLHLPFPEMSTASAQTPLLPGPSERPWLNPGLNVSFLYDTLPSLGLNFLICEMGVTIYSALALSQGLAQAGPQNTIVHMPTPPLPSPLILKEELLTF